MADTDKGLVYSIFLREKTEKFHRLILNLKNFSKLVVYRHFKMDNLSTALGMVRKNCFVASIDLTNAYFLVPLAITDQNIFCLNFSDSYIYIYVCLPNGLSSAPRIFTKILKPVLVWDPIMGYLDGSFLVGDTFEDCVLLNKLVEQI